MQNMKLAVILICALILSLSSGMSLEAYANSVEGEPVELNIDGGSIVVKNGVYVQGSSGDVTNDSNSYLIRGNGETSSHTIKVQGDADVELELKDVNISSNSCAFAIEAGGKVTLILTGENSLQSGDERAGLEVPVGAELIIAQESTGSIQVTGGQYAAGIGGKRSIAAGVITIEGGTIEATGGSAPGGTGAGAGIGGGRGGSGGTITIGGGEVTSTGGYRAAGIGGGQGGSSGEILITGGTVTADVDRTISSASYSAGIGGGYAGPTDTITIRGGTITAKGGTDGAGIGSGRFTAAPTSTDGGTINISGGSITAASTNRGAGIGGGLLAYTNYCMPITINISGGTIEANSDWGPGIGSNDGVINITGGDIAASSNQYSAGIGGNYNRNGGTINIDGGTIVAEAGLHDTGNSAGAAIGGGCFMNYDSSESGPIINITGGNITATNYNYGAGIGGGTSQNAGVITITGGHIVATGHHEGAGIGIGSWGEDGSISISQTVLAAGLSGNSWRTHDIDAGENGTVTIGGTEEGYDPFDDRAEITINSKGIRGCAINLGTCLIKGEGENVGSWIEGVREEDTVFWTDLINKNENTFARGSGAEGDPYQIETAGQLAQLAYNTNSGETYEGKYFVLTADLDLGGWEWMPIGIEDNADSSTKRGFRGSFDGNDKKIEGFTLTNDSTVEVLGLFGYIGGSGQVKNLNISGGTIDLSKDAGGYSLGAIAGYSRGLIENCTNECEIRFLGEAEKKVGGIVGQAHSDKDDGFRPWEDCEAKTANCHNQGRIEVAGTGSCGGIAGEHWGNDITGGHVWKCSNSGKVTAWGKFHLGGLVGQANKLSSGIEESFNRGDISLDYEELGVGVTESMGGLVGYQYQSAVKNSYNWGQVDRTGLASSRIGGISGLSFSTTTIENCYNTGLVTGAASDTSAIIGENNSNDEKISNNYFLATVGNSPGITDKMTALTESQMKDHENYVGWEFGEDKIWTINPDDNDGYPALVFQGYVHNPQAIPTEYKVTVESLTGGTISADPTTAAGGETINLIITPDTGKRLKAGALKYNDGRGEFPITGTSFTMPETDVTVTAEFEDLPAPSSAGGGGSSSNAPQPTIPVAKGSVKVDYTSSQNTVTLVFTPKKLNEITSHGKAGEVDFDLTKMKDTTEVKMPKTAVSHLGDAGLAAVFKLPQGSITIDSEAAKSITEKATGNELKIELKKVAISSLAAHQRETVKRGSSVFDINIISQGTKITIFNGKLNIVIPYNSTKPIAVWHLGEDGKLQKIDHSYKNGMVSFTVTHLSYYVLGDDEDADKEIIEEPIWNNPYKDVQETDWYYDAVKYASINNLMVGTSETEFSPRAFTTRGMIVTILHRLEGAPGTSPDSIFTDVSDGKYYTVAVNWATQNNIVSGYGNGKFGPEDAITREQMAAILMNYTQFKGYEITEMANLSQYADTGTVSDWALDAMGWANSKGLIVGNDGKLSPTASAERCQVAAILQRSRAITNQRSAVFY